MILDVPENGNAVDNNIQQKVVCNLLQMIDGLFEMELSI